MAARVDDPHALHPGATGAARPHRRMPWEEGGVPSPNPAADGHANGTATQPPPAPSIDPSLLPNGRHALSGISMRGYFLGMATGISSLLTLFAVQNASPLWRPPFFVLALSVFHFLEFYTTARYNTAFAEVKAYLLSANGTAYNVAHTVALLETTIFHTILSYPAVLPELANVYMLSLGFTLLVTGQFVRSFAMKQAGQNFNHTVQVKKAVGHELVTHGVYAYLRHPSYFGFFWWSLGSQIILGNPISFIAFALVLWKFFSERIKSKYCIVRSLTSELTEFSEEETFLVKFFSDEYVQYRKRTTVGIPFIR
jgi:protein-S-isoprenylcysteine O-methyltransferase